LVKTGDPELASEGLGWKEFEAFSESAFRSFGFVTKRNYRLKKPRVEIDLLASKQDFAFVVDCKHWKRTAGHSSMIRVSEKQIIRTKRVAELGMFQHLVPAVLTWRDESLYILENRVPIVPIHRLSDFILNWDQPNDPVLVIPGDRNTSLLPSGAGKSFVS
jgi:hypothetical protein